MLLFGDVISVNNYPLDKESNHSIILPSLLCVPSSAINPPIMGLLYSIGIIQPVLITETVIVCQNSINKHWFTFQMTAHFSQAWALFYLLFMNQIAFLHKYKLLLMSTPWDIWKGYLALLLLHGILFAITSGYSHYHGTSIPYLPQALTGQGKDCEMLLGSVASTCFADFFLLCPSAQL